MILNVAPGLVDKWISSSLSFNRALTQYLAYRMSDNERRWLRYQGPVRQRVARVLVDHAYDYSETDELPIVILTQTEIADLTATSVTGVEKELNRLRGRRVVDTLYGAIRVLQERVLEHEAG